MQLILKEVIYWIIILLLNEETIISHLIVYFQIFPDIGKKREILNLKVKCPNEEESCKWTTELRKMDVRIMNFCWYYTRVAERLERFFDTDRAIRNDSSPHKPILSNHFFRKSYLIIVKYNYSNNLLIIDSP